MSTTATAATAPATSGSPATSPLRRLLVRPEMGAVAGAIAVWIFFALVAGHARLPDAGAARRPICRSRPSWASWPSPWPC